MEERKEGDLIGARQSGGVEVRHARLPDDDDLLARARDLAGELLGRDPALQRAENRRASRARAVALSQGGGAVPGRGDRPERLLVAQRLDRVETRRAPGGPEPEDDADAGAEAERERHRRRARPGCSSAAGWLARLGDAGAEQDAERPAEGAEHERLDQELEQDVARGCAPSAIRTPISRVRSVTETSMMFMIPMPPTRRLTAAIPASR